MPRKERKHSETGIYHVMLRGWANQRICPPDFLGLYFWGIGDKPSNCPSWVPDIPDGDDSNINYGALDSLGYLQELPEGITINDFKPYTPVYSTSSFQYGIVNGGTFAIYGELELINNGRIRVCEGGTLLVEGGILDNADIVMVPGSQLIIRD